MSSTTVHQVTVSARSAVVIVTACFVAIALSITLPFVLQSTKTVLVRTTAPAATSPAPAPMSPQLLRSAHGG